MWQAEMQTPVAEPAAGFGQLAPPYAQSLIRYPPPSIPARRTIQFHQPAGASLAQLYFHRHHRHDARRPLLDGEP